MPSEYTQLLAQSSPESVELVTEPRDARTPPTSTRSRKLFIALLALGIALVACAGFALRRAPTPEAEFRQALAALEQNDLRTTVNIARRLATLGGFEEHARYLRAACLVRTGDFSNAIAELSSPPRREELRVPMTLLVIEAFYQSGRLAEAEAAARHLISLDEQNVAGHRWLASILYDLGANQAALAELTVLQQLAPDDFAPYHLMGQILFDAEQFSLAADACRQALNRHPPESARHAVVRQLTESLVRQHDFRAALEAARPEIDRSPSAPNGDLLALMAECHWVLGEKDEADRLIDRARAIDPHEALGLRVRSRILTERGEYAAAIPLLEELLEHDPHDFESRYKLATACQRLGNSDRAATEMERMRESQALRRRLSDLSEEAASRPEDAAVRDELASVCEKLGMLELAQSYRRAAEACRQTQHRTAPQHNR